MPAGTAGRGPPRTPPPARYTIPAHAPLGRRGRHSLLHLPRPRRRTRTLPENRPPGRRHRRRHADDRHRRHLARRGLPSHRLPHPRAALRHDGAHRAPAHGAVLQRHGAVDRRPRAPADAAARRHRLRQRHPLGPVRQRHDLPGLHPGSHRARPRPRTPAAALPPGARHRREHRQRRDDHRQPAEHADRQPVAHPLRPVPRRARAGRALRPGARRGRAGV